MLKQAATLSISDAMAMLKASGDYRVLRRVPPLDPTQFRSAEATDVVCAIVDCEATSRIADVATPIEISVIKFAVTALTRDLHVVEIFSDLNDPGEPLDEAVAALTGLTDVDLRGRRVDRAELTAFFGDVRLVVAHNCAYDRVLLERFLPDLPELPWCCTLRDVDWSLEGLRDRRLGDLLDAYDLFNDGHRALADCASLFEILKSPLPRTTSYQSVFQALIEGARRTSVILFAEEAPFEARHGLKQRGYRWSSGENAAPKCWYIEVAPDRVEPELAYLEEAVYRGCGKGPTLTFVTAKRRYRSIAWLARDRVHVDGRPAVPRSPHGGRDDE